MRIVVQRVSEASVKIDNQVSGEIKQGLLVLLGITSEDTEADIEWLVSKLINLRIFNDEEGKMNLSVKAINGDILLISQFTLHGSTKKGNRPSFINAARPETAIPLYNKFKELLSVQLGKEVASGQFGADMKVSLTNDGPVTLIIDSQSRE